MLPGLLRVLVLKHRCLLWFMTGATGVPRAVSERCSIVLLHHRLLRLVL